MTEFSGPFTNGLTDGGPWSAATWWRLFRAMLGPRARVADVGVVRDVLNELAVTSPGADQVTVATGQAFVQGTLYESDAANTLTATRPSGGTTGKRVVLRRDTVNGGIRATVIASADGTATLPSLTQDADGNYDIPLASFTHATDGSIASLTDEREFMDIGGAAVPIVADAFEWGTKVATRYTANFASADMWDNAVRGDLADAGWRASSPTISSADPTAARAGDLDSASDSGAVGALLTADTNYITSPPVIGGKGLLDAIEQVTGTRPTTILCWISFQFASTADAADVSAVGIGNDGNAVLAGAGRGYFIAPGATNFEFWDGSAATDLGVAKDASQHLGAIEIDIADATYRVLLDGDEVKAAAAITQDIWPMAVQAYRGPNTTNNPMILACGVNYD